MNEEKRVFGVGCVEQLRSIGAKDVFYVAFGTRTEIKKRTREFQEPNPISFCQNVDATLAEIQLEAAFLVIGERVRPKPDEFIELERPCQPQPSCVAPCNEKSELDQICDALDGCVRAINGIPDYLIARVLDAVAMIYGIKR